MAGHKFSPEDKAAFWKLFCKHRDAGLSISKAWLEAARESRKTLKSTPSWATFKLWYKAAVTGDQTAPEEQTAPAADQQTGPAASDKSDRSDKSDKSDYTGRLELIVKLYRFRRESDVDAVCDCLLPDLD